MHNNGSLSLFRCHLAPTSTDNVISGVYIMLYLIHCPPLSPLPPSDASVAERQREHDAAEENGR